MKHWWTSWLIIFILAILPSIALSETPARPPPDTAISWDVHRSLGIVMVFETDRGKLYFAHPIIHTQMLPECTAVRWEKAGQHLWVIETNLTTTPVKHTVLKQPTGYRYEGEQWQPWVWQSFKELEYQ